MIAPAGRRRRPPYAWCAALAIALPTLLGGAAAHAQETFNVAIKNKQFYAQTDANGAPVTFESALIQELCATMKVTCKLQFLPFAGVLDAVEQGRVDIGLASVIRTPSRERRFLFTSPYLAMNLVFIAKAGKYSSVDDCMAPGRRVAVAKATSSHNFIVTKPAVMPVLVDDGADAIAAASRGEVDCALTVTFHALSELLKGGNKYEELEMVGNPISQEGFTGDAGIILPLHSEKLRDRLNQALRAALADGRYDALTSKFLPFSFY